MQRVWVGAVAVAAVVLAVLLLGSPDTGSEVSERTPETPDIAAPEVDSELVRGPTSVRERLREISPPAVVLGEDGKPLKLEPGNPLLANPFAKDVMTRRLAPESQYAARVMAPWTQIRRELSNQGGAEAQGLIEQVEGLIGEYRHLRRDPATRDFEAIIAQQEEVEAAVRNSSLVNEEIDSMLALTTQRLAAYEAGEYDAPPEPSLEAAE